MVGGSRRLAASASKGPSARLGSVAGGSTMKRRQEMLRGINTGDAVLLLGGDLSVTVVQAQGLAGPSKSTHPFARVHINEPFPTSAGALVRQNGAGSWAGGRAALACRRAWALPALPAAHPPPPPYLAAPRADEARAKQTTVVWQSCDPVWDEQLVFRDVCAASELQVEMWDLGGNRSTAQLDKLAQNPSGAAGRRGGQGRRLERG